MIMVTSEMSAKSTFQPEIVYSTFLGGQEIDNCADMALDAEGNPIVLVNTILKHHPDDPDYDSYPYVPGSMLSYYEDFQIAVTKVNRNSGLPMYSAFIADFVPTVQHYGEKICTDSNGNALIMSTLNDESYMDRLNDLGTELSNVYSLGYSDDNINAIATDKNGNIYFAGNTTLWFNITPTPGVVDTIKSYERTDGFILKVNPTGDQILFATYFGAEGGTTINDMVVDDEGYVYITGDSYHGPADYWYNLEDSPHMGLQVTCDTYDINKEEYVDAYVAKIGPNGDEIIYCTVIGGSKADEGKTIQIDKKGNVYITGITESQDFPISDNAYQSSYSEPFFLKLNTDGTELQYASYLQNVKIYSTDVTDDKRLLIAGAISANSNDTSSEYDGFYGIIDNNGQLINDLFILGGSSTDWCRKIIANGSDVVYICGYTESADFPITENAFDTSYAGGESNISFLFGEVVYGGDVFLTKIDISEKEEWGKLTYVSPTDAILDLGYPYEIGWIEEGNAGRHVRIDLFRNGSYLRNIRKQESILRSYQWYVPPILTKGAGYQIRIQSIERPDIMVMSEPFEIGSIRPTPGHEIYSAMRIPWNMPRRLDGILDEPFWNYIDADSLLKGGVPGAYDSTWSDYQDNLVTWKAVWYDDDDGEFIYVGIDVQDDIAGQMDNGPESGQFVPSQDESLEFAIDGNLDGGEYWPGFNMAQYLRVSRDNVVDLLHYPNVNAYPSVFTGDQFDFKVHQFENGNWTCEAVFKIYNDFPTDKKHLGLGDRIGWDIWYNDCDNESQQDGYYTIDHQTGWNYKGKVWRFADFCGELVLGDLISSIHVSLSDTIIIAGKTTQILWEPSATYGNDIRILLIQDEHETTLVSHTENDGSYDWFVANDFESSGYYRVKILSNDCPDIYDRSLSFYVYSSNANIEDVILPYHTALHSNYPNPFNPTTTIPYSISRSSPVRLTIYNVLGKAVRTLVNKNQPAGEYQIQWDGQNEAGQRVSSGIFVVEMRAGEFVKRQKMMLLR